MSQDYEDGGELTECQEFGHRVENGQCVVCGGIETTNEPDIDMENQRRREYNEGHFDDEVKS